jgi:rod shape determining protein RodA
MYRSFLRYRNTGITANRDDLLLLVLLSILMLCGVSALYSTALGSWQPWAVKQVVTITMFLPLAIMTAHLKKDTVYRSAYWIYALMLLTLIFATFFGHKAMGAQRWIRIGVVNFQPSELMKVAVILALSRYYSDLHLQETRKVWSLIPPLLLVGIPALFILKQPNLGTASLLIIVAAGIAFVAGLRVRNFILAGIIIIGSTPLIWHFMHDYQRQRVLTFLHPERDPLGTGYNIMQSVIAIGSGGFWGKGFLNGSQSQLSFLPEKQTDFILSVIAEEFGFLGVVFILLLSTGIVVQCYKIAFLAKSQLSRLIIAGMVTSFSFHAIINAAMIAGLMPVVGMPYPLLSYGGSNLAGLMLGFGLVLNRNIRN